MPADYAWIYDAIMMVWAMGDNYYSFGVLAAVGWLFIVAVNALWDILP